MFSGDSRWQLKDLEGPYLMGNRDSRKGKLIQRRFLRIRKGVKIFSFLAILVSLSSSLLTSVGAQDLYLIVGQSNAAGRGALPTNPVALEGVEVLDGSDNFVAAFPDLNVFSTIRNLAQEAGFNLGYTFAEQVREDTGRDVQLVVNARGGTSIVDWAPGVIEEGMTLSYFDEAIRRVNAALAANPEATFQGILWHQGEANRNRSAYLSELVALIADFREELGDVPFVAGQLSFDRADNATFNDNLLQLPSLVSNSAVVSAEGLATVVEDDTHFNAEATQTLGRRYAEAMMALQGVEPPTTGPLGEGVLLFADTFDRVDSDNLNASGEGQSGSLVPLLYSSSVFKEALPELSAPDINSGSLRTFGTDSNVVRDGSVIYLEHNFTDAAILDGGGFSVSVDIAEYNTIGNARQMSVGIGQSREELTGLSSVRLRDGVADLLVAYRETSSTLEIYKSGILDVEETVTSGLPDAPTTMRIDYSIDDFTAGSTVSFQVFFDSETAAFATGTFVWSGTNENYLGLSSNLSADSRFDNLEIRAGFVNEDYNLWTTLFPSADLTDSTGDFDRDGFTNNEERLFGLNPTDSASVDPYVSILNPEGTFAYTRREPSLTDHRYRVFTSTDLITWTEDLAASSVASTPDENSVEVVTVTLTAEPQDGRLFARIVAEPES